MTIYTCTMTIFIFVCIQFYTVLLYTHTEYEHNKGSLLSTHLVQNPSHPSGSHGFTVLLLYWPWLTQLNLFSPRRKQNYICSWGLGSRQLPIYTSSRDRATWEFIWSHVCVHLVNVSTLFFLSLCFRLHSNQLPAAAESNADNRGDSQQ